MEKSEKQKLSEIDVCDLFITPAIKQAGWDQLQQIRREVTLAPGPVIVRGNLSSRNKKKRKFADYVLSLTGVLATHAGGSSRAKASEMEHAIRKHCTIHFDEDPAFFKRMSEKLDTLIAKHGEDWKVLAEAYEELRAEIRSGRGEANAEQPAEVLVFRDNLFDLIGDGATLSVEDAAMLDALSARLVSIAREAIAIVDFWSKPDQVRRLRANIDTELMVSGIGPVQDQHQRIAVELTKLTEKRHTELLRP